MFLSLDLPRCDLVDEDLGTTHARLSCTLLPLVLRLDRLEPLDLHHHVKSLLLADPVLFELLVLPDLLVAHRVDSRGENHGIHVLHVVVVLVHLLLSLRKQRVFAKLVRLDFEGCVRGALSILHLHTLPPGHCHSHLLRLLLVHRFALGKQLRLFFDYTLLADALQIGLVDDTDLGFVEVCLVELLTDLAELAGCDHGGVRPIGPVFLPGNWSTESN